MDFYDTFKKREWKSGVTELIIFHEGQIQPQPHRFIAREPYIFVFFQGVRSPVPPLDPHMNNKPIETRFIFCVFPADVRM